MPIQEAFKLSPSNIEVLSVLGTDYLKKGIGQSFRAF